MLAAEYGAEDPYIDQFGQAPAGAAGQHLAGHQHAHHQHHHIPGAGYP